MADEIPPVLAQQAANLQQSAVAYGETDFANAIGHVVALRGSGGIKAAVEALTEVAEDVATAPAPKTAGADPQRITSTLGGTASPRGELDDDADFEDADQR
jgi:hypothetical protein